MAKLDSDDLKAIKRILKDALNKKIYEKLGFRLNNLPTRDEFYTKMDEVMGELKTIREEQTLISHTVSDHEDRIEKIESHLGLSSD